MIDGITVMATESYIAGYTHLGWNPLYLVPIIFVIFILAVTILATVAHGKEMLWCLVTLIIPIIIFCALIPETGPTYKDQYIVTIDKNVSLVEFYNEYDIVEHNGELYTIRLKEDK